jgi:hypothetical protein
MTANSLLSERETANTYTVSRLGHWSEIQEAGGTDKDLVKFFGTEKGYDAYVGISGKTYYLIQK